MTKDQVSETVKVLVVDDHEVSRRFTLEALRQNGMTVKQTDCAEAAYSLALDWRPDVMLVDIQLSNISGLDLIERLLRDWPGGIRPPRMIAMSALSDPAHAYRGSERAMQRVLQKPASTAEILDAIRADDPTAIGAVSEDSYRELQGLFRQELRTRIPELDSALSSLDLARSRTILHQLIASSAICGHRGLEIRMRELDRACGNGDFTRLGRPWFELVRAARDHLERHLPSGRRSSSGAETRSG